ncbi:hypothetical protein [Solidesulfovibrio sp.]
MFIRVKKAARMTAYLDVAESARVDGKPRQRIVLYLGRLSLIGPGLLDFWLKAWKRIEDSGLPPDMRYKIVDLLLKHVPCPVVPPKDPRNSWSGFDAWCVKDAGNPPLPFGQGTFSPQVLAAKAQYDEWKAKRDAEYDQAEAEMNDTDGVIVHPASPLPS